MASPLYDALVVKFSKMAGDPVAAATTDGKIWTGALRDVIFNQAQNRWLRKTVEGDNKNALRAYIATEAQTLSGSALALSSWTGGVSFILSVYNATDAVLVKRLPDGYDAIARAGTNSYYTASSTNQFWKQESGSFRLLGGTATSSIRLEYVKAPVTLASNGASEVLLVPPAYYDELVDLAFKIAKEEKAVDMQVAMLKEQIVEKGMAQTGKVVGDK
jgi:subtilisin family serine protease